jgi:hypothetical protein
MSVLPILIFRVLYVFERYVHCIKSHIHVLLNRASLSSWTIGLALLRRRREFPEMAEPSIALVPCGSDDVKVKRAERTKGAYYWTSEWYLHQDSGARGAEGQRILNIYAWS